ncbi:MAG: hypothetical protein ACRERU_15735 [Methylococcales bacterium]
MLQRPDLPLHNNFSERDLRGPTAKIQRQMTSSAGKPD